MSDDPVDLETLRVVIDGGADEERLFFDLFLQGAKESLVELYGLLEAGDQSQWSAAAHRFKGSAANLGAHVLSNLCKDAETMDTTAVPDRQKILADIKQEFDRVEAFLSQVHI